MQRRLFRLGLAWLILSVSIGCVTNKVTKRREKGAANPWLSVWKPFAPKRVQEVYDHTIVKMYRAHSDCQPDCPRVDVWKYAYRGKGGKVIESREPIASKKEFWKVSDEARIMAVTLYGDKKFYYDGLLDYIDSFTYLKDINHIDSKLWGYETFTVRVYVAKRNPAEKRFDGYGGETPDEYIQLLLDRGVEVAYVDNHEEKVGKDATFWRFLVAAEKMPEGQRIRYILRDADWTLTAGEAYSVGEWIESGLIFHRWHLVPMCIGPLTAMMWGGQHEGRGKMHNMLTLIENFPYRYEYGDDELFLREMVWPKILFSGSVMTHLYPRGFKSALAMPYRGSCEEPTQEYCDAMRPGGNCPDVLMPEDIPYPGAALGLRKTFKYLKREMPEVFDLHPQAPRSKRIIKAFFDQ